MAVRPILLYPDKRLRESGNPVAEMTPELRALIEDMAETMYAAPGVGLAATQIGEGVRIFVLDLSPGERSSEFQVFVNPEILETRGEVTWEEGCLSFPGVHEDVVRSAWLRLRAQDVNGRTFEREGDGLFAVAVQHEMDHLAGVTIIDRVSFIKRRLIHRAMMKRSKDAPAPAGVGAL